MGKKKQDQQVVTFRDITLTVMEMCEISDVHWSTFRARLARGWNIEAAAIARPDEMVRTATSDYWITKPENQKRADALYKKIAAHYHKRQKPNKRKAQPVPAKQELFTKAQVMKMLRRLLEDE